MGKLRINRALALAGAASRRGAEELVRAGRVRLNGEVVSDLAAQVDPQRDKLTLDGRLLKLNIQHTYFIYNKPRGLISTLHDERGRAGLEQVCGALPGKPRPVGRLDRASEGLMLLTTDGDLALRLTHPRYGISKEYQVTVEPALRDADARTLVSGIELDDGPARFEGLTLLEHDRGRSRLGVVVTEGRYRLIRRAFEALDYRVLRLRRVRLGQLQLGRLAPGQTRQLSAEEALQLRRSTGLD